MASTGLPTGMEVGDSLSLSSLLSNDSTLTRSGSSSKFSLSSSPSSSSLYSDSTYSLRVKSPCRQCEAKRDAITFCTKCNQLLCAECLSDNLGVHIGHKLISAEDHMALYEEAKAKDEAGVYFGGVRRLSWEERESTALFMTDLDKAEADVDTFVEETTKHIHQHKENRKKELTDDMDSYADVLCKQTMERGNMVKRSLKWKRVKHIKMKVSARQPRIDSMSDVHRYLTFLRFEPSKPISSARLFGQLHTKPIEHLYLTSHGSSISDLFQPDVPPPHVVILQDHCLLENICGMGLFYNYISSNNSSEQRELLVKPDSNVHGLCVHRGKEGVFVYCTTRGTTLIYKLEEDSRGNQEFESLDTELSVSAHDWKSLDKQKSPTLRLKLVDDVKVDKEGVLHGVDTTRNSGRLAIASIHTDDKVSISVRTPEGGKLVWDQDEWVPGVWDPKSMEWVAAPDNVPSPADDERGKPVLYGYQQWVYGGHPAADVVWAPCGKDVFALLNRDETSYVCRLLAHSTDESIWKRFIPFAQSIQFLDGCVYVVARSPEERCVHVLSPFDGNPLREPIECSYWPVNVIQGEDGGIIVISYK